MSDLTHRLEEKETEMNEEFVLNKSLYSLYEDINVPSITYGSIIFFDGEIYHSLSYSELDEIVDEIATHLSSLSASNEVIGCICLPSLILPAFCLGILKVSSAFAILDAKRVNIYLENISKYVNVQTVLVEEKAYETSSKLCSCWDSAKTISTLKGDIIIFQKSNNSLCNLHSETNCMRSTNSNPIPSFAYVIQTSGTTGIPKVIEVPHQCILPNILHFKSLFNVKASDVILSAAPLTFDPFIIEVFLAISCRASIVFVPDYMKALPDKLANIIIATKVTILQGTPTLLKTFDVAFLKERLLASDSELRILALGGEKCLTIEKLNAIKHPQNKTRIFNLYGLTEVSCWAMCKEIQFEKSLDDCDVSLGSPLMCTEVDVRDEVGNSVSFGTGELFVGSHVRWCLINGEPNDRKGNIIPTGDWVTRNKCGEIFFDGRRDDSIKHHGKKLPLRLVEKTLDSMKELSQHVLKFSSDKLFIFAVKDYCCSQTSNELRSFIVKTLRGKVTDVPVLDVTFVPFIPLTSHGKTDLTRLMNYTLRNFKRKLDEDEVQFTENSLLLFVKGLWKDYTGRESVHDSDNFILNGGNSISALQLVLEIEQKSATLCSPELIDKLLNQNFKTVFELLKVNLLRNKNDEIKRLKFCSEVESRPLNFSKHNILLSDALKQKNEDKTETYLNSRLCYKSCTRREICQSCFCGSCFQNELEGDDTYDDHGENLKLVQSCRHDLRKCIDASVCLVDFLHSLICYVGSHSGCFAAFNIVSETKVWDIELPDRIESSACISACGHYILVGCYDYHLYCFASQTGILNWKMKTKGEIKSSPAVSKNNVAFVGSHDQYLYAVNIEDGLILWKTKIGCGSIFSSPVVSSNFVCAATLDGVLATLNCLNGDLLWKYQYGKPLFSSPLVIKSSIVVGCVDGCMLQFNLQGNVIAKHCTGGPIFSSASYFCIKIGGESTEGFVFGSHDAKVYCCSLGGSVIWSYKCSSPVYSTPCCFTYKKSLYTAVASTNGTMYILCTRTGKLMLSVNCPGEVFSSPVVLKSYLVIGCRDNYLYVYKLFRET